MLSPAPVGLLASPSALCASRPACPLAAAALAPPRRRQVILLFPTAFWSDELDMFGHVAGEGEDRGEAFLFYSYTHISGGALLVALYSGGLQGGARLGWSSGFSAEGRQSPACCRQWPPAVVLNGTDASMGGLQPA
jgi:hypothetical protein